jgi:hypothetical protein
VKEGKYIQSILYICMKIENETCWNGSEKEGGMRKNDGGVNLIKIYYKHIFKCPNETPLNKMLIKMQKNTFMISTFICLPFLICINVCLCATWWWDSELLVNVHKWRSRNYPVYISMLWKNDWIFVFV